MAPFTREDFVDISSSLYGPDTPLMNSVFLVFIFRSWLSVLLLTLMAVYVYCRTRIIPHDMRKRIDILYSIAVASMLYILISLIYAPVNNSFST